MDNKMRRLMSGIGQYEYNGTNVYQYAQAYKDIYKVLPDYDLTAPLPMPDSDYEQELRAYIIARDAERFKKDLPYKTKNCEYTVQDRGSVIQYYPANVMDKVIDKKVSNDIICNMSNSEVEEEDTPEPQKQNANCNSFDDDVAGYQSIVRARSEWLSMVKASGVQPNYGIALYQAQTRACGNAVAGGHTWQHCTTWVSDHDFDLRTALNARYNNNDNAMLADGSQCDKANNAFIMPFESMERNLIKWTHNKVGLNFLLSGIAKLSNGRIFQRQGEDKFNDKYRWFYDTIANTRYTNLLDKRLEIGKELHKEDSKIYYTREWDEYSDGVKGRDIIRDLNDPYRKYVRISDFIMSPYMYLYFFADEMQNAKGEDIPWFPNYADCKHLINAKVLKATHKSDKGKTSDLRLALARNIKYYLRECKNDRWDLPKHPTEYGTPEIGEVLITDGCHYLPCIYPLMTVYHTTFYQHRPLTMLEGYIGNGWGKHIKCNYGSLDEDERMYEVCPAPVETVHTEGDSSVLNHHESYWQIITRNNLWDIPDEATPGDLFKATFRSLITDYRVCVERVKWMSKVHNKTLKPKDFDLSKIWAIYYRKWLAHLFGLQNAKDLLQVKARRLPIRVELSIAPTDYYKSIIDGKSLMARMTQMDDKVSVNCYIYDNSKGDNKCDDDNTLLYAGRILMSALMFSVAWQEDTPHRHYGSYHPDNIIATPENIIANILTRRFGDDLIYENLNPLDMWYPISHVVQDVYKSVKGAFCEFSDCNLNCNNSRIVDIHSYWLNPDEAYNIPRRYRLGTVDKATGKFTPTVKVLPWMIKEYLDEHDSYRLVSYFSDPHSTRNSDILENEIKNYLALHANETDNEIDNKTNNKTDSKTDNKADDKADNKTDNVGNSEDYEKWGQAYTSIPAEWLFMPSKRAIAYPYTYEKDPTTAVEICSTANLFQMADHMTMPKLYEGFY